MRFALAVLAVQSQSSDKTRAMHADRSGNRKIRAGSAQGLQPSSTKTEAEPISYNLTDWQQSCPTT